MDDLNLSLIENQDYRGESFKGQLKESIRFVNCNFSGADLEDVIFVNCSFEKCKFKRTNLKNTKGLYLSIN